MHKPSQSGRFIGFEDRNMFDGTAAIFGSTATAETDIS